MSCTHNIHSMIHTLILYTFSLIFTHSYGQCLDHQKTLLLQLKNDLKFNSSISTKLVQWNQTDDECCEWYGVECDGAGNVISLQLDDESISGGIGDSSTLFKLTYLQKLNLAYNDFNCTSIPRGIHNLTYLTHLNLSHAAFGGQVPSEISLLIRLVSLDISNVYWGSGEPLRPENPNLKTFLQNLTGLRELHLDRVNITSSHERWNWSHIISSHLPHLTTLSLVDCSLSGPLANSFSQLHSLSFLRLDGNDLSSVVLDLFANFSSLATLSLVGCGLNGSFPKAVFCIPTLQHLDLSINEDHLSGIIPPFTQIGSLESIRLSGTNFSGSIPSSISNLKALSVLDLSFSQFNGSIPSIFANLTQLTHVDLSYNMFTGTLSSTLFEGLSNLVYVDLGANSFFGNVPHSLFGLPFLHMLGLYDNQFTGQVEEFPVLNVSNIVWLVLSYNQLDGPIPDSIFKLQSLESLLISDNLFSGNFQLDKIQSLPNLTCLYLSRNKLSIYVSNDNSSTYKLPKLRELGLASCNLKSFPEFIKHSDMSELDLSDNQVSGEIPSWIWGTQLEILNLAQNLLTDFQKPYHIPASLRSLLLQSNQLRGELDLPISPSPVNLTYGLRHLLLSNNSFCGSIPTSLCSLADLYVLDLSSNKLSGHISPCLLENISLLRLGKNNISGRIPNNFPLDCSLKYFDVNNNTLEGKIPESLTSCKTLELMNVGNNNINDTFPCIQSSELCALILHSNRFHGDVTCQNSWPNLQIADISSNNFSGSLKSINFSSWRAMVLGTDASIEYASNYYSLDSGITLIMKGLQMELLKIWEDFGTIDFSCNNFQGEIPNAIGDLMSLHLLNLSHNALVGSIPKSFGKLGDLESLDLSQNQLTGHIPMEISRLTFLSFLNLSYNKLVGEIPNGRQLQTFSADSFKGNQGLCGFNLNISCSVHTDDENRENEEKDMKEIEWEYVSAALGYAVGLGSFVWLLLLCRSFRQKYFDKIDGVVEDILDSSDKRIRRGLARRRASRNRVVRR